MAAPTVLQIIADAKISQFLVSNAIRKANTPFSGGIDINLPRKLYNIRKSVAYWYTLDSTDETLSATSKYLYALCGKYALIAANVTGGGGSISPVIPFATPAPIEFIVAASGTFMVEGQSSVYIPQFVGYNVMFNRGNIPQMQVDDGLNSYFTWNRSTGLFTVYGSALLLEPFSINAV